MAWRNDQVSGAETDKIIEIARDCLRVAGDFVEMGCYKGDTSLLLAEVLVGKSEGEGVEGRSDLVAVENSVENSVKKLWIYDSFEGLPEKGRFDESVLGVDFREGELMVTKREVKERFLRAGLMVPKIVKGWFEELTEVDLPEEIAFAFLDGDFYESIKCSLRLVGARMVDGGVIVVHDYNNPALPGVMNAVDEWVESERLRDVRHRLEGFESMVVVY